MPARIAWSLVALGMASALPACAPDRSESVAGFDPDSIREAAVQVTGGHR